MVKNTATSIRESNPYLLVPRFFIKLIDGVGIGYFTTTNRPQKPVHEKLRFRLFLNLQSG